MKSRDIIWMKGSRRRKNWRKMRSENINVLGVVFVLRHIFPEKLQCQKVRFKENYSHSQFDLEQLFDLRIFCLMLTISHETLMHLQNCVC